VTYNCGNVVSAKVGNCVILAITFNWFFKKVDIMKLLVLTTVFIHFSEGNFVLLLFSIALTLLV